MNQKRLEKVLPHLHENPFRFSDCDEKVTSGGTEHWGSTTDGVFDTDRGNLDTDISRFDAVSITGGSWYNARLIIGVSWFT